jgi:hypothetical protein
MMDNGRRPVWITSDLVESREPRRVQQQKKRSA